VNVIGRTDKRVRSVRSPTIVAGDLRDLYLFVGSGTERKM